MRTRPINPATLWSSDGIHRQGSLDGLCGIYCAINSISLQLGDKIESAELFKVVIRTIGRRLPPIILGGMLGDELERNVLEPCKAYLATKGFAFTYKKASAKSLDQYWSLMIKHFEKHGEGSILLSISGSYEHWTCLRHISSKCIILADSGTLDRLYRARVTIKEPTKSRIHGLLPSETYLLSIK